MRIDVITIFPEYLQPLDLSLIGKARQDGLLTVATHDLREDSIPDGGPFHLVHVRLVLIHQPQRRAILDRLIAATAPRGWLVIEEFDCTNPLRVLHTPGSGDADLFDRYVQALYTVLQGHGAVVGAQRLLEFGEHVRERGVPVDASLFDERGRQRGRHGLGAGTEVELVAGRDGCVVAEFADADGAETDDLAPERNDGGQRREGVLLADGFEEIVE